MHLKYCEEVPDETEISVSGLDMFVLGERREGDVKDVCHSLSLHCLY